MIAGAQNNGCDVSDHEFWSIAKTLLATGRRVAIRAVGGSMKPLIWPEDTLVIDPCDCRRLKFGDIVLFTIVPQSDVAAMRIHRVMKMSHGNGRRKIFTRGDASDKMDEPITPEHILGRVTAIKKGRWILNLDRPVGKSINWAWSCFQYLPVSFHTFLAARKLLRPLHRAYCSLH
jgi:hypothetical protein